MSRKQASKGRPARHKPQPGPAEPARRPKPGQSALRHTKRRILSHFHHHQEVAVDSLARLFKDAAASTLTWTVIGIALALPLCLFLLLQNLQQFGSGFQESARISLFMEKNLDQQSLSRTSAELQARQDISDVQVISAQQALAEFQQVSGFGEALAGLDENPLPPVLVVTPAVMDAGAVEVLHSQLQGLAGVDFAQLDLQWLQRLFAIIELARRASLWLTALLCLGVVLVIGNTVRLAIENRRSEIVVVKLVGGTDAFVARPFLYTGLWYGIGGGIIAWFLLQISLWALRGPVSRLAGYYESSFALANVDISGTLLILAGSGLLGWAGAWVSVVRHLRAIEPR
ncbi:MAG: permease-like cell division protein FtsX [Pseudohongiellaceae bacterium]